MHTSNLEKAEALVSEVIRGFDGHYLDPYGTEGDRAGVPEYLFMHKHEYVRTISDILNFFGGSGRRKILEIGAFYGVVSICLSRLGFEVCAADTPEYVAIPAHAKRFQDFGVHPVGVRLQNYLLPFESDSFDCVIMCEVLEHLNFNPLPLIKEINRISKIGSLFYLALPNLAQLHNRLKLLFGRSIHPPIRLYFDQLDKDPERVVEDQKVTLADGQRGRRSLNGRVSTSCRSRSERVRKAASQ